MADRDGSYVSMETRIERLLDKLDAEGRADLANLLDECCTSAAWNIVDSRFGGKLGMETWGTW